MDLRTETFVGLLSNEVLVVEIGKVIGELVTLVSVAIAV
jgi:hypothetical protein